METSLSNIIIGQTFINRSGTTCIKCGAIPGDDSFLVLMANSNGIVKGFSFMKDKTMVIPCDDVAVIIPKSVADVISKLEN
jgi:hypothetical protein